MSDRACGEPRRVAQAASGERQAVCAGVLPHHVHQRAGGELRQVTQVREEQIVGVRRGPSRDRAEPGDERLEPPDVVVRPGRLCGKEPRPAVRTDPPRASLMPPVAAPASGWPPMKRSRAGSARAASAIVTLVLPTSVTSAGPAHVVGEPFEDPDVLANRRGQDDQIGVRHHDQIVATDVDGVKPHRGLEDVLAVDRDHEAARPALTRRQRERAADQAAPDDADTREEAVVGVCRSAMGSVFTTRSPKAAGASAAIAERLQPRLPRHAAYPLRRCAIPRLAITLPSRAARPARGRCCGRWPAR